MSAPRAPNGCQKTLPGVRPVDEPGAEAIRRLGLVDEVVLVDAEETSAARGSMGCVASAEARDHGLGRVDDVD